MTPDPPRFPGRFPGRESSTSCCRLKPSYTSNSPISIIGNSAPTGRVELNWFSFFFLVVFFSWVVELAESAVLSHFYFFYFIFIFIFYLFIMSPV